MRVKSALICAIYSKSLVVDLSASKESIGRLNNLISVDVTEIQNFCCYSHYIWATPLEIILSSSLLFSVLGISALSGMFLMILSLIFGFFVSRRLEYYQDQLLKNKDKRMEIMNEVLQVSFLPFSPPLTLSHMVFIVM